LNTVAVAGGDIMEPVVSTEAPAKVEWKSKHKFFGFSQIGVKFGDGAKLGDDAEVGFEADRIRLGWKYFSGPIAGKVFLDFVKEGKDNSGIGVPDLIKMHLSHINLIVLP